MQDEAWYQQAMKTATASARLVFLSVDFGGGTALKMRSEVLQSRK